MAAYCTAVKPGRTAGVLWVIEDLAPRLPQGRLQSTATVLACQAGSSLAKKYPALPEVFPAVILCVELGILTECSDCSVGGDTKAQRAAKRFAPSWRASIFDVGLLVFVPGFPVPGFGHRDVFFRKRVASWDFLCLAWWRKRGMKPNLAEGSWSKPFLAA